MANSGYQDTVDVLRFLQRLYPMRILDVGAGFGRWGFLCRCHLGGGVSLTHFPSTKLIIDAIEIFDANISPVYDAVYNHTFKGDARALIEKLDNYDVIICSHMIEHMPKEEGWALLEAMKKKAKDAVLLGVPFNSPLRGAIGGNVHESHLAVWIRNDFKGQDVWVREYPFLKNEPIALAIYPLSDDARWLVKHAKASPVVENQMQVGEAVLYKEITA